MVQSPRARTNISAKPNRIGSHQIYKYGKTRLFPKSRVFDSTSFNLSNPELILCVERNPK